MNKSRRRLSHLMFLNDYKPQSFLKTSRIGDVPTALASPQTFFGDVGSFTRLTVIDFDFNEKKRENISWSVPLGKITSGKVSIDTCNYLYPKSWETGNIAPAITLGKPTFSLSEDESGFTVLTGEAPAEEGYFPFDMYCSYITSSGFEIDLSASDMPTAMVHHVKRIEIASPTLVRSEDIIAKSSSISLESSFSLRLVETNIPNSATITLSILPPFILKEVLDPSTTESVDVTAECAAAFTLLSGEKSEQNLQAEIRSMWFGTVVGFEMGEVPLGSTIEIICPELQFIKIVDKMVTHTFAMFVDGTIQLGVHDRSDEDGTDNATDNTTDDTTDNTTDDTTDNTTDDTTDNDGTTTSAASTVGVMFAGIALVASTLAMVM